MFTESKSVNRDVTTAIKGMLKAKDQVQKALMGIAYQVQENGNAEQLTRLIYGLSGYDIAKPLAEGEKILLCSEAKQIGRYMRACLPVKWDSTVQRFKSPETIREGFDYGQAADFMGSVRWDHFEKSKADNAFDEEKEWKKIIAGVKRILANADEGSKTKENAAVIARAFAIEA